MIDSKDHTCSSTASSTSDSAATSASSQQQQQQQQKELEDALATKDTQLQQLQDGFRPSCHKHLTLAKQNPKPVSASSWIAAAAWV